MTDIRTKVKQCLSDATYISIPSEITGY